MRTDRDAVRVVSPAPPCVRRVWCVAGAPCHAGRRARVSLRHVDVMGEGENVVRGTACVVGSVDSRRWGVDVVRSLWPVVGTDMVPRFIPVRRGGGNGMAW